MVAKNWNHKGFTALLKTRFSGFSLDKLNSLLERLMTYKKVFQTVKPSALKHNGFQESSMAGYISNLDELLFKVMYRKSELLEAEQLPGQVKLFGLGKVFDEARRKKSYIQDGIEYIRQGKISKVVQGKKTAISFALNKSVAAYYSVIEADKLQPSHIGAIQNPLHFIPEAQPRNRATSQSGSNTPKIIAENLRPAEIVEGATAYTGAPVINERGEAIQGNGRAYTLKLYYDHFPDDPAGYKAFIEDSKACYGFTESIKDFLKPVIVRVVNVSDEEAITLGQYTQKDLEAVAGETTLVKSKVGLVTDEALDNILDELLRRDNGEKTLSELIRESSVLRQLVKENIIRADDLEVYTRNQVINETGVNFVAKLLLNLIFKDGDVNTPDIFTQLPTALQKAIEKSALFILKVRGQQNIAPDVSKSILGLRDYLVFKPNGSLAEWKTQADIFGNSPLDKFSELEFKLIELFGESTTHKQIIEPFKQYAFWATTQPGNMFDPERPALSKAQAVQKAFGITIQEKNNDMELELLTLRTKALALKFKKSKTKPVLAGIKKKPEASNRKKQTLASLKKRATALNNKLKNK